MGTSLTEINRTLKRIEEKLSITRFHLGASLSGGSGRVDLSGVVNAIGTLKGVLDAILSDTTSIDGKVATEATLSAIETLLAKDGGFTIAELLSQVESSLNTLITANAANFAANIAQIVASTAVNVAAIVANAATTVAGIVVQTISLNGSLQDIEDIVSTKAKQDVANADLDDIRIATEGSAQDLADIKGLLEDLTFPDSNVDVLTFSPATDKKYTARPDSSDSTAFLHHIAIKNGDPIFPITFRVFLRDGTGNKAERPDLLKTISGNQTGTILLNLDIRRACFLQIEASIASSHVMTLAFLHNGAITFDSIP